MPRDFELTPRIGQDELVRVATSRRVRISERPRSSQRSHYYPPLLDTSNLCRSSLILEKAFIGPIFSATELFRNIGASGVSKEEPGEWNNTLAVTECQVTITHRRLFFEKTSMKQFYITERERALAEFAIEIMHQGIKSVSHQAFYEFD